MISSGRQFFWSISQCAACQCTIIKDRTTTSSTTLSYSHTVIHIFTDKQPGEGLKDTFDDFPAHHELGLYTVRFTAYNSSWVKGFTGFFVKHDKVIYWTLSRLGGLLGDFQNVSNDYAKHDKSMLLMTVDVMKASLSQLDFILLKMRCRSSLRMFWCSAYLIFSHQCFALQKFYVCRGS